MSIHTKYHPTDAGIAPLPHWEPSRRLFNSLGFLICAGLLAFAYYLQLYENLPPCPLCSLQRLAMAGLGAVFLVAAVHDPTRAGSRAYAVLIVLMAGAGAGIAARHVWLQYLPAGDTVVCLPGLDYLLQSLPLAEAIGVVLLESKDCSGIDWTFLGLSIPIWTLLAFLGLGTLGAVRNWLRG